ncbi:MAG TPA: endonuclease/exonuclease/phosphatase family protein [Longimicrobiales bacterium]|nr:endonuclease/exonuclease/phosphatase family protein [Longimicrobiales bacterium]
MDPYALLRSLAAVATIAACASTPAPAPDPLRVLVYNIHAGKDAAGEVNLARVAAVIGDAGADVVLLQEVDRGTRRAGGSYEPRGALRVVVDAPGGVVGIVNTHLDPSRSDAYRRQEVEAVRRIAADLRARHPRTIVGGDFNAEPGSATIGSMLADGWRDAWSECGAGDGGTYPADAPIKRIDYVLLAPGFGCADARVVPTTTSDHRPVLVTLTGGP